MLIDIKIKLGFSILKFEKEMLDIKHQIELLASDIESHTKLKKGLLSREGQIIYTQAYRDTYLDILEKSKGYIFQDFKIHSKAFEHVYERYLNKTKNYREKKQYSNCMHRTNSKQIQSR